MPCLAQHGVVIQPLGSGFNPHPANRPGDANRSILGGLFTYVSIRTRLTDRVMHFQEQEPLRLMCFNPHPANRPGDAMPFVTTSVEIVFQSAPG